MSYLFLRSHWILNLLLLPDLLSRDLVLRTVCPHFHATVFPLQLVIADHYNHPNSSGWRLCPVPSAVRIIQGPRTLSLMQQGLQPLTLPQPHHLSPHFPLYRDCTSWLIFTISPCMPRLSHFCLSLLHQITTQVKFTSTYFTLTACVTGENPHPR